MAEARHRELRAKASIVGIGETAVGLVPGKTSLTLHIEAAAAAIRDSGLKKDQIDGVLSAPSYVQGYQRQSLAVAEALGIRPRYSDTCQTSGGTPLGMVLHAVSAINSGLATAVLITAGDNRATGQSRDTAVEWLAQNRNNQYEAPYGPLVASMYAMWGRRHMHDYGTTSAQLASVAVTFRQHAQMTGRAHMMSILTVEDVLNSKMITSPYRMYDCSLVSDGGCAMVVVNSELAKSLGLRQSYVLGIAEASTHEHMWYSDSCSSSGGVFTGAEARKMAGVSVDDINVAEIYDCFTGSFLINLEDLGFCKKGEAGPFCADGQIGLDGKIPCNTHGGLLSYCHSGPAGSMFHVIEAVRQLRGECGERQVPSANIALAHGMGGVFSSHATAILGNTR